MRSPNDLYLFTINFLMCIYVYDLPPLPLEGFTGNIHGSARPDAQSNPPHICQTPLPVYHRSSEFPCENLQRRRKKYEHKTSFKGNGDGNDGNGAKVFAYFFHCQCYKPVATFTLYFLAHAYPAAFKSVKRFLSLDVTVVLLVQMEKLVYINSDSNQEEIRGEYKFWCDQGANMEIALQLLAIVRNKQY